MYTPHDTKHWFRRVYTPARGLQKALPTVTINTYSSDNLNILQYIPAYTLHIYNADLVGMTYVAILYIQDNPHIYTTYVCIQQSYTTPTAGATIRQSISPFRQSKHKTNCTLLSSRHRKQSNRRMIKHPPQKSPVCAHFRIADKHTFTEFWRIVPCVDLSSIEKCIQLQKNIVYLMKQVTTKKQIKGVHITEGKSGVPYWMLNGELSLHFSNVYLHLHI